MATICEFPKGKKHDYLGMNLDFLLKVQVAVTMVEHPKGVISDLEKVENLTSTTSLSAAKHLYTVREECDQKKIDEKLRTAFHPAMSQLLFACPKAREDIYTAVSFLTTRFPDPDEDDWIKLKRLLCMPGKLSIFH